MGKEMKNFTGIYGIRKNLNMLCHKSSKRYYNILIRTLKKMFSSNNKLKNLVYRIIAR